MLKLAYQYILYYKSQAFAILASIILTAALLSGMSSLMYSSICNDLENKKAIYGNWHYSIVMNAELPAIEKRIYQEYSIVQCGKAELMDMITEPYFIYFIKTDEAYRTMAHRNLIEGHYPKQAKEVAMDRYTLGNLGFSQTVGDSLFLDGKEYILTGIIESAWAANTNEMEIFVGENFLRRDFSEQISEEDFSEQNFSKQYFSKQGEEVFYYLQFDEKKALYQQLDAFLKQYKISNDAVTGNDEVIAYLKGEKPDSIYDIIKFALTNKQGNFTYILLKLQSEYQLSFYGMLFLLCFFSLFVIYSIFNISAAKRLSEYGIMQTLGISETCIGITLVLELWILFLIGYPLGCFLGNGILQISYQKLNGIFSGSFASKEKAGTELSQMDQIFVQKNAEVGGFHIAGNAIGIGFVFLLTALAVIAFLVVRSMRKQSIHQIISGDSSFIKKRRRIYSRTLHSHSLASLVVRKFLFSNKRKLAGILLSLSVGGCIFLCTTYMVENLKIHAQMSMKSDDGLGSDYKISIKSKQLNDTIPETTVDAVKSLQGLSKVYAAKYILGELIMREQELEWKGYFDERNKDGYFQQYFGGMCVKKENGTYGIKYDIYGYDNEMIEQLRDFLLEGEIIRKELEKENKIIAVANMDGQGNYNFYGKHSGDKVIIRVPKDLNCSLDILKFQDAEDNYIEKEFEIAAIISRTLAKEDNFLAVKPWNDAPSFIMTNKQMKHNYGIKNYRLLNLSLNENNVDSNAESNADKIEQELLYEIKDVPKAILQNYTSEIKIQERYLQKQQMFFSGIAVILLVISLFHIMNSMNYSILSHRREYGIIRAMGITNIGFYKMIVKAGLFYGLLTDGFIFLFYHMVLRKWMDYYMIHIVQFVHGKSEVPNGIIVVIMILNLLIAVIAVFIPARRLVRSNIIKEISG